MRGVLSLLATNMFCFYYSNQVPEVEGGSWVVLSFCVRFLAFGGSHCALSSVTADNLASCLCKQEASRQSCQIPRHIMSTISLGDNLVFYPGGVAPQLSSFRKIKKCGIWMVDPLFLACCTTDWLFLCRCTSVSYQVGVASSYVRLRRCVELFGCRLYLIGWFDCRLV